MGIKVVLSDGTVIDGNRRFTSLRMIEEDTKRPQYLRCHILDSSLDETTLKCLELELQFGREERVDYDPVARLVDVYEWCIRRGFDKDVYAARCGMKKSDMNALVEEAELMAEFLELIEAPEQFHIAQDLKIQGPLHELRLALRKIDDEQAREDLKMVVFSSILTKTKGDISRYVREVGKIAESAQGIEFIEEQMDIASDVLDKLANVPEGQAPTVDFIREEIRADEDLVRKQEASFERSKRLVDNEKIKDGQVKAVDKALCDLQSVEAALLPKLSEANRKAVRETLASIIETSHALIAATRCAR